MNLVMCALKGSPDVKIAPALASQVTEKVCQGTCGRTIVVSPSSAAIPHAEFMCNDCGKAAVANRALEGAPVVLGIPPGALQQPGDDARRRELEAVGFRDVSREEMNDL